MRLFVLHRSGVRFFHFPGSCAAQSGRVYVDTTLRLGFVVVVVVLLLSPSPHPPLPTQQNHPYPQCYPSYQATWPRAEMLLIVATATRVPWVDLEGLARKIGQARKWEAALAASHPRASGAWSGARKSGAGPGRKTAST